MIYSQDILEEISNLNDIVDVISSYVNLKQRGNSYIGLCPFHSEKTPSFSVNPDKQLFYCFGCGFSGNIFTFIRSIENVDFVSAVKILAEKSNYTLPEKYLTVDQVHKKNIKDRLKKIHLESAKFFYENLNNNFGVQAREYLKNRGISDSIRKKFGLGYCSNKKNSLYKFLINRGYNIDDILLSGLVLKSKYNNSYYDKFDDRLIFPIFDINTNVVAFGGRILKNGDPKYLNSPKTPIFEKSQILYSLNFAKRQKTEELILVEGYLDVITMYQFGIKNVVATLGTALNNKHANILKKYSKTIVIFYDNDEAGSKACLRAIPVLLDAGIDVKILDQNIAKDPDEFMKLYGKEVFDQKLKSSDNYVGWKINKLKQKFDLTEVKQKIEFSVKSQEILLEVDNDILIDAYSIDICNNTGFSIDAFKKELYSKKNKIFQKKTNYNYIQNERNERNEKNKKDIDYKGLVEAKKNLLYLVSIDYNIFKKIKHVLKPEELVDKVYIKTLDNIFTLYEKGPKINYMDVINNFEDVDEQKIVSSIFANFESNHKNMDLEKAVNDYLKVIKKFYIDYRKKIYFDNIDILQQLVYEERNLKNLNITLIDG